MNLVNSLGINQNKKIQILEDKTLLEYVNLMLMSMGQPYFDNDESHSITKMAVPLLSMVNELRLRQDGAYCPADRRIIAFLDEFLKELPPEEKHTWLPYSTITTDRHGVSRVLSLPPDADEFHSEYISSYRVCQGILHNPKIDRRTTKGVFHVVEGGPEVPADKLAVPKLAFCRMLKHACNPPEPLLEVPFTSTKKTKAYSFVSGYLKPIVCPKIPSYCNEMRMEIRFFTPGSLVNFLDMVESIFGSAGCPFLAENDVAFSPDTWTGHSGCIIIAPHLTKLTKKELGLPRISEATDRQIRDGMCWEKDDELYHDGQPFKIMARTNAGVVVSIIADSYNGYGKKEIKTHISYSANLMGICEEEHSGGAVAFASYDLSDDFSMNYIEHCDQTMQYFLKEYGNAVIVKDEGYAIDKMFSDIIYVPEDAHFLMMDQKISWSINGHEKVIDLVPGHSYMLPCGYRIKLLKPKDGDGWRMIGIRGDGVFCHKPSTVSGGGKSEISKSISDNILLGSVVSVDFDKDCDVVDDIINHDYSNRYKINGKMDLHILDRKRSLGSVIKMFTQNKEHSDEHNAWLRTISPHLKDLLYVLKVHYRDAWGSDWRKYFSVDLINGANGNELKYLNNKLVSHYLRIGLVNDKHWRTFTLRHDFYPAKKIQMEDDITATAVVPTRRLNGLSKPFESVKFVENCEFRLYQRPDDAIIPGYDHGAELDMTMPDTFLCNYHPLTKSEVADMIKDNIGFSKYTEPMQKFLQKFLNDEKSPKYVVCPSKLRKMPDGKFSTNPRYLQNREDLLNPRTMHMMAMGLRLANKLTANQHIYHSVDVVVAGRRNNPPENGIKPLCVHNPLHYLELPELFMEFASNMTGKSPSTTGAGLEGVMTKGPFNCLSTIIDLNNTLVSFLVTGYGGFISSAGCVGPNVKIGHDISYLIPEIVCRMTSAERNPKYLIENGFFEKCNDIVYNGKTIACSRLGYRITKKFVSTFFGRILSSPDTVFSEEILKPELQDMDIFADSMENIVNAHQRAANIFFEDGSIAKACPPIKALLYIMAKGDYEGMTMASPEFRDMFSNENILDSDWYIDRLRAYREVTLNRYKKCLNYMLSFCASHQHSPILDSMGLAKLIEETTSTIHRLSKDTKDTLAFGTIGADPAVLKDIC
ncbi:MAG: hypothetical protein LBH49_01620 [Puniceicoccales bacterium]|jgi:hypothetical protein|nr:hypothetical protein [Puniceicoccales bacterium]